MAISCIHLYIITLCSYNSLRYGISYLFWHSSWLFVAKRVFEPKLHLHQADVKSNKPDHVHMNIQSLIEGILLKGPYPPCLRMSDRSLLAGYPHHVVLQDLCSDLLCYIRSAAFRNHEKNRFWMPSIWALAAFIKAIYLYIWTEFYKVML